MQLCAILFLMEIWQNSCTSLNQFDSALNRPYSRTRCPSWRWTNWSCSVRTWQPREKSKGNSSSLYWVSQNIPQICTLSRSSKYIAFLTTFTIFFSLYDFSSRVILLKKNHVSFDSVSRSIHVKWREDFNIKILDPFLSTSDKQMWPRQNVWMRSFICFVCFIKFLT